MVRTSSKTTKHKCFKVCSVVNINSQNSVAKNYLLKKVVKKCLGMGDLRFMLCKQLESFKRFH